MSARDGEECPECGAEMRYIPTFFGPEQGAVVCPNCGYWE